MSWLISEGKFVISRGDNKFILGRRPCIEYAFDGTAAGVVVGFVDENKEIQYRRELAKVYTMERLTNAKIIQLSGTSVGTVKFKITPGVTDKDAPLELLMRSSDGTWTSLYDDYLPSDGYVTVEVSEFGPIIGLTDDYCLSAEHDVIFEKNDALIITKKENL